MKKYFLFPLYITLFALTANLSYADECCPEDPCDCGKWSVRADFLYWRPCTDGIYVAADARINKNEQQAAADTILMLLFQDVKAKNFGFKFDGGVRFGIAYESTGCCCFGAALLYTYFSPEESKVIKIDCSSQLTQNALIPFGTMSSFPLSSILAAITDLVDPEGVQVNRVKGNWKLSLHLLDFELGRPLCVNNCLLIRPHIDLRFARIDQDLTIKTNGDLFPMEAASPIIDGSFRISEHFENTFTGLGPRAGLNLDWDLGCGFGLYGNSAISLLYGEREASNRQKGSRVITPRTPTDNFDSNDFISKASNNTYCTRAITDLELGAFWNTCFCEDSVDFILRLGWEHHYFFNQGVADAAAGYILNSKEADSTLSTQGLTLSAHLRF